MVQVKLRVALMSALLCAGDAHATGLQWSRAIETEIEYLADSTSTGESDISSSENRFTVTPSIGIRASGRQASYSVDASVVAIASSESEESEISPRLAATSSVFSVNNGLQFDSAASVEQRPVNSPFLQTDTVFGSRSTERVTSLSAGPLYQQSFGRTSLAASYSVGTIDSSETDDSSSIVQAGSLEVTQLLPNPQWVIGSRVDSQHTNFESAPSALSRTVALFTDYQFRNNLSGRVTVGRDDIEVDNALTDIDGNLWGVGVNWILGRRVTVDASYIERSFGRQPNVSVLINGRRSSVGLSWTRNLGISTVADNTQFGLQNASADSLNTEPETGQTVAQDNINTIANDAGLSSLPLFQESRNINETLTLSYTLNGRLSVFTASLSRIDQENLTSVERSESTLLEVSLSRRLTRASTVIVSAAGGESRRIGDVENTRSDESSSTVGVLWNLRF